MEKQKLICIACPMGCRVTIMNDDISPLGYKVEGNTCKRGESYAIKEITAPSRTLTSTVKIKGAKLCRLPVVTKGEIPKGKMFEAMELLNHIELTAPVKLGDVVIADLVGSGAELVATRSMGAVEL